jgi:hypothetical protein
MRNRDLVIIKWRPEVEEGSPSNFKLSREGHFDVSFREEGSATEHEEHSDDFWAAQAAKS